MLIIIKRLFVVLLLFFICIPQASALTDISVSAKSYVLIDHQTGEIIVSKNADTRLSMASTTKIMTSILAIESGKLNCTVTAQRDIFIEGTALGIRKGESYTLKALVYAMMLESGNDAALLTAEYLSGSEQAFSQQMNKKAAEIGMLSTNFVTASGLDAKEHYTTANDMAVLASYAIKNPIFKQICSTKAYTHEADGGTVYTNHNKLLDSVDGVFGIKTGFTKKSGRCLVSACERNGTTLIAVTLNAPDDWNDHKKLYDYGFSLCQKSPLTLSAPSEVYVYGSDIKAVQIKAEGLITSIKACTEIRYRLKKFIYAPVKENEIVGYADVYLNGRLSESISLVSCEAAHCTDSTESPKYSFLYKLKQLFN